MKTLIVAILLAITTASAFATITGRELLNYCTGNQTFQQENQSESKQFCIGYIAGFLDTYVLVSALHGVAQQNRHFCLGQKGITYKQAMQTAIDYLQANPNSLNDSARKLLIMAYAKNYPCQTMQDNQQQQMPQNDQQQTPQFEQNSQQNDRDMQFSN